MVQLITVILLETSFHSHNSPVMDGGALKHFKLPDDKKALEGTFKAKCMHCSSEIKGSLKVTSNFVTHLRVRIFFFPYIIFF